MPKGVCCGEKTVLVTVYVERPRTGGRRRVISSPANHNNRQHHHHDHPIKRTTVIQQQQHHHKRNGGDSRGYDRRAELLHYSHDLREKARSTASTPLHPANTPIVSHTQQPLTKSVSVRRKHKHSRVPSCLGSWKILIPRFLSSLTGSHGKKKKKKKHNGNSTTTTKMKSLIKSLEEQKKWEFATNFFSTFRKKR